MLLVAFHCLEENSFCSTKYIIKHSKDDIFLVVFSKQTKKEIHMKNMIYLATNAIITIQIYMKFQCCKHKAHHCGCVLSNLMRARFFSREKYDEIKFKTKRIHFLCVKSRVSKAISFAYIKLHFNTKYQLTKSCACFTQKQSEMFYCAFFFDSFCFIV